MVQSAVEKTRIVPFSCIELFHKSTFSCSFFSFSFPRGVEWLAFWPLEKGREMEYQDTLPCIAFSVLACLVCLHQCHFFLLGEREF